LNTQEEKKEEMEDKRVGRKCARTEEGCTVKTVTIRTSTKNEEKRLADKMKQDKEKGLKSKVRGEPTEAAALARQAETMRVTNLHKRAMKSQGAALGDGVNEESALTGTVEMCKMDCGKNRKQKKTTAEKKAPNMHQGWRQVPTPTDDHGCKHHGLRDLDPCDNVWLAAYVKEGAWLDKKPCIDCAAQGKESDKTRERVLDAAVLLRV
jgi:hypothetical protein